DEVAPTVGRLVLCDAASNVRASLARRFAHAPNIEVRAPEDIAALPPASVDFIFIVSVAQYVSAEDLDALLTQFRRLLKSTGRLVIADVVPRSVSPLVDAAELLRLARANGFLAAALAGLARTALSDYRKLRQRVGLSFYDEAAMRAKLARAGYSAVRAPKNIGHNQNRMTFIATPI
ncbi:MAG TPA: class I SAM-dependent methyltransferase, partial [Xanthobacteraceae bacterium]|nr:class I SAM-dependent methyltransferase [Xanthobacteraceae bacterium]